MMILAGAIDALKEQFPIEARLAANHPDCFSAYIVSNVTDEGLQLELRCAYREADQSIQAFVRTSNFNGMVWVKGHALLTHRIAS